MERRIGTGPTGELWTRLTAYTVAGGGTERLVATVQVLGDGRHLAEADEYTLEVLLLHIRGADR